MNFQELITKLGFEVDEAPLEKVEKNLEGIHKTLEFLAAAEVVKGLYEMGERFAHFAEELHIAAESAGVTVEAFQKLSFAATQSGVSSEEMSGAMARLSRHLYQARLGGVEAQRAFAQAGFSGEQVSGFKTGADVMLALSDRFKNIQDPIQKQALAMELMGRGSVRMVGFLSQGSGALRAMGVEAQELGAVLTGKQVEALVSVEHSLLKVTAVAKAFGATIAVYLAPIMNTAIKYFLDFYKANRAVLETNVKGWAEDLAYALGFIHGLVAGLIKVFLDFTSTHQLMIRRVFEFGVALGVVAVAILAAKTSLGLFKDTIELFKLSLSPIQFAWQKIFGPAIFWIGGLVKTALVELTSSLAVLALESFPALGVAIGAFSAFIEATPVGWLVTGLVALVAVLHDAWTLLSGGSFKDTWLSKVIDGVKGFTGKFLSFFGVGGAEAEGEEKGEKEAAKTVNASEFPGIPHAPGTNKSEQPWERNTAARAQTAVQNIQRIEQVQKASNNIDDILALGQAAPPSAPQIGEGATVSNSNNTYTVNAPISIEVPAGTDHKVVGEKVKQGVKDHLDRVYRDTYRSLTPAVTY